MKDLFFNPESLPYTSENYEIQNFPNEAKAKEECRSQREERINKTSIPVLKKEFVEKARGSVKIVWVEKSKIPPSGDEAKKTEEGLKSVYFTAIDSFLGRHIRELKSEFKKMQAISRKLELKAGSTSHLAVDGKELLPEEQVKGKYTIEVEEAADDFEKKIRDSKTSLEERIQYGSHFLNGLENLHFADYAHGDIKPENCLIFNKKNKDIFCNLKLSDFGKTKEIKEGKATSYTGNLRYAPPEFQQSKEGDVYGAALVLIRNFEEEYLKEPSSDTLVLIEGKDRDVTASRGLRGIEKYIVEHKAFPACNPGFSLKSLMRRLIMRWQSQKAKPNQVNAIHHYIDALQAKLQNNAQGLMPKQIRDFCDLLKQMTAADPHVRITARDAATQYRQIFKIFKDKTL
jgi:serine/threonine protein kinase